MKGRAHKEPEVDDLRELLDDLDDLAHCVRPNGSFLWVNRAWREALGYGPDEVARLSLLDVVAPPCRELFQRALAGEQMDHVEAALVGKGGCPVAVEGSLRSRFEQGRPVATRGLFRQVGARGPGAEAVGESRHMLEVVLNNIPQGAFWKDRRSAYLGCNQVVCRAMGVSTPDELIGKTDHEFPCFTRQQADFFVRTDREVMEGNVPRYGIVEPMTCADGSTIWLETSKVPLRDGHGQVVGILGTWQDITLRKRAEEALRESEARLRLILKKMPAVLWTTDRNLRVTSSTGAGLAALGLKPGQLVGTTIQEYHQNDDPTYWPNAAHIRALEGQASTFPGEWAGRSFQTHLEPLRDASDQIVGVIGVCLDVTERRQAEEEHRKLQEKMLHAQKLESLGLLAGGIAHDFNNLLTGVLGYANLAQAELPAGSPARALLQEVENGAERAGDLAQQMLAYSGRGKFVVRPVALDALVREMTRLLQSGVSRTAVLHLDLAPATVECDATQIRQVVMNLITNASDALGSGGGVIGLRTGVRWAGPAGLGSPYLPDRLPEGNYAFVEVADSGCGMSDETLRKIFDPFFTTKFTGRGLGLAAVLGVVRGHHGTIQVSSSPGQGSTFTVLFPFAAGAAEHAPPAATAPPGGGSGLLLVVDDEDSIRLFVGRVLANAGFQVRSACDGLEGVEVFQQLQDEVVGVVLDLTMPRMDGLEAAQRLQQLRPGVPILLMSGYNEQETSSRFAGLGVAGFLQKPFRPADLLARVRQMLASRWAAGGS
jgi:PAS domain S-box-containing protein